MHNGVGCGGHHASSSSSSFLDASTPPSSFPASAAAAGANSYRLPPPAGRSTTRYSESPPSLKSTLSNASTASSSGSSSHHHHHSKLPKFLRRGKDKTTSSSSSSFSSPAPPPSLSASRRRGSTGSDSVTETSRRSESSDKSVGSFASSVRRPSAQHVSSNSSSQLAPTVEASPLSGSYRHGSSSSVDQHPLSPPARPPKKASKVKTLVRRTSKLGLLQRHNVENPPAVYQNLPLPPQGHRSNVRRSISPASASSQDPTIVIEPPSARNSISSPHRRPSSSPQQWAAMETATPQHRPTSYGSTPPAALGSYPSPYQHPSHSNGSQTRLGDMASAIPSRLGGWLSGFLPSGGASASSSPSSQVSSVQGPQSPPRGQRSIITAARDKSAIMWYLTDSEAKPDRREEGIWIMGRLHEGYRPASLDSDDNDPPPVDHTLSPSRRSATARSSTPASPGKFSNIFASSTLSLASAAEETVSPSLRKGRTGKEELKWPAEFYSDFQSSVWCTYRSQYPPIVQLPPTLLSPPASFFDRDGVPLPSFVAASLEAQQRLPLTRSQSGWNFLKGGGGSGEDKQPTTDAGWGCMLRTGQSLLANSLLRVHLGRNWREPPTSPTANSSVEETLAYATYARILSWFLDDPSPYAPFSVHRMALVGKQLGKDVGEWFGPSTAAGAIRNLTEAYPFAGLSVSLAADSVIFRSDVLAASHPPSASGSSSPAMSKQWGGRPVLILVGLRLGLDGVNPVYHETMKNLFTFPQSVGIAGGRPNSSYYFLGYQADSLFYLDPHHTRPAVPLRVPPSREELEQRAAAERQQSTRLSVSTSQGDTAVATTPSPATSPSSGSSPNDSAAFATSTSSIHTPSATTISSVSASSASASLPSSPSLSTPLPAPAIVDPLLRWYADAYPSTHLHTFHCDAVRKMRFTSLDPSMLLGFLIRDEREWLDFCARVGSMPNAVFSVADEPSHWGGGGSDDEDPSLDSFSETDPDGASMRSESVASRSVVGLSSGVAAAPSSLSADANFVNDGDDGDGDLTIEALAGPHGGSGTFVSFAASPRRFEDPATDDDDDDRIEVLQASSASASASSSLSSPFPMLLHQQHQLQHQQHQLQHQQPPPQWPKTTASVTSPTKQSPPHSVSASSPRRIRISPIAAAPRPVPPPPNPGTPEQRPAVSRSLGSEFELVGEEEWLDSGSAEEEGEERGEQRQDDGDEAEEDFIRTPAKADPALPPPPPPPPVTVLPSLSSASRNSTPTTNTTPPTTPVVVANRAKSNSVSSVSSVASSISCARTRREPSGRESSLPFPSPTEDEDLDDFGQAAIRRGDGGERGQKKRPPSSPVKGKRPPVGIIGGRPPGSGEEERDLHHHLAAAWTPETQTTITRRKGSSWRSLSGGTEATLRGNTMLDDDDDF